MKEKTTKIAGMALAYLNIFVGQCAVSIGSALVTYAVLLFLNVVHPLAWAIGLWLVRAALDVLAGILFGELLQKILFTE